MEISMLFHYEKAFHRKGKDKCFLHSSFLQPLIAFRKGHGELTMKKTESGEPEQSKP